MQTYEISIKDGFYIGDISFILQPSDYHTWEEREYPEGIIQFRGTQVAVVGVDAKDVEVPSNTGEFFNILESNVGIVPEEIAQDDSDELAYGLQTLGMYVPDFTGTVTLTKEDNGNVKVEWGDNIVRLYTSVVPEDLEISDLGSDFEDFISSSVASGMVNIPGFGNMQILKLDKADFMNMLDSSLAKSETNIISFDNGNKIIARLATPDELSE